MYKFILNGDTLTELLRQLILFLLLWFSPIKMFVNLVLFLVAIDFITGLYASLKRGDKFRASKMVRTVEKIALYSVSIISAYLLQKISGDGDWMPRVVALFIGATELKSIFENVSSVTGTNVIGMVWQSFKDKIDDIFTKIK